MIRFARSCWILLVLGGVACRTILGLDDLSSDGGQGGRVGSGIVVGGSENSGAAAGVSVQDKTGETGGGVGPSTSEAGAAAGNATRRVQGTGGSPDEFTTEPACLSVVSALDEDFSAPIALDCWGGFNFVKIDSFAPGTASGVLQLVPKPASAWYGDNVGALLYRAVEGDFIAETRLRIRNPNVPEESGPGAPTSGGGLVVYNPLSQLNVDDMYYIISLRSLSDSTQTGVKAEYLNQTTRRLERQDGEHLDRAARLRACRVKGVLVLAYAPFDSADWKSFAPYDPLRLELPDLPSRVYVGLTAFQFPNSSLPESQSDFDYLRIRCGDFDLAECTKSLD